MYHARLPPPLHTPSPGVQSPHAQNRKGRVYNLLSFASSVFFSFRMSHPHATLPPKTHFWHFSLVEKETFSSVHPTFVPLHLFPLLYHVPPTLLMDFSFLVFDLFPFRSLLGTKLCLTPHLSLNRDTTDCLTSLSTSDHLAFFVSLFFSSLRTCYNVFLMWIFFVVCTDTELHYVFLVMDVDTAGRPRQGFVNFGICTIDCR